MLGKECTSTLWVSKVHRGAWKTGHNARRGAALRTWWRKTLRPKRVRFLAIDAPILDRMCLPLNHLTLISYPYAPSLRVFVKKRKKERKSAIKGFWFSSISSWHESAVYCAALPHRYTLLYNMQVMLLEILPCQCPLVKRSGVAYSCSYALLLTPNPLPHTHTPTHKHYTYLSCITLP